MIAPGSTIGMLGGGQLGRMFTVAAHNLGYKVMVLEPDPVSPAGKIADHHICAPYDDSTALNHLASTCSVVTTEFENIPATVLNDLANSVPVRPAANAVLLAQDRIAEKDFIESCNLLTVNYGVIKTHSDIAQAVQKIQFPARMKTARLGYDGKGQQVVNSIEEVKEAYENLQQVPCVLEQQVDLATEISVVMARNSDGKCSHFPVGENEHRKGILHKTRVPAQVDASLIQAAKVATQRIADKLDYVGILAVEYFITKTGELLVNEMAPRTHNSGHFSMDACYTSQFEQQVRTICGLPFGSTELRSPVAMINLLGDVWGNDQPYWSAIHESSQCKLHLYGKDEARQGRKMGHYNVIGEELKEVEKEADRVFAQLQEHAK